MGSVYGNAGAASLSLIDPEWELIDPTPDLHTMFLEFDKRFFWGSLNSVEVRWSPRMTLCAGLCLYQGRAKYCSIRLSKPLLQLRPRKDFVETLLHEMIHAYLFVTENNRDHDAHGPNFHLHMNRINAQAGTKISVYHNFHDEVDSYRQHWWRCDGPCVTRPPFYGIVRRSMNRAPGPNDRWWAEHQKNCGGKYTKIREPDNYGKKKEKQIDRKSEKIKGGPDRREKSDPKQNTLESFFVKVDGTQGKVPNSAGEPSNVREQSCDTDSLNMKRDWSKFGVEPPPREPITKTRRVDGCGDITAVDVSSDSFVECPNCKETVEASTINSHLDECLNQELLSQFEGAKAGESKTSVGSVETIDLCRDEAEDDNEAPSTRRCPVCGVMIDVSSFDEHVESHDSAETGCDDEATSKLNPSVVLCPVCFKPFSVSSIQQHVDEHFSGAS